ncbi:MAG: transglycosylase SLT domain-containing protein [Xanthomonadales bacterium]|nr:transglycosylase SLT domain-containing protein [Xanthomonadales bacterium]
MNQRLPLLLTVILALGACATQSPRGTAGAGGNGDRETTALYERLARATARFAEGSRLLLAGDARGNPERDAALEELRLAGERCVALPQCEAGRFLAAYESMVREAAQAAALGDRPEAEPATIETHATSPVLSALPESQRTITLLRGRDLAQVIELNEPVKAAINEWLTWLRPNLIEAWENYQYMRFMMWPEYEQAGLPEALLFAIMARESQGKVHAVSHAGAAGPLQFMPATGARFGLGRNEQGFDTRYDPRLATRAQVRYLNEQFDRLNENLELVVAAYNGGEGRLGRLSGNGSRSLWDPEVFGALPRETQIYVPMVLAAAWLFLHPEQYGLAFPRLDTRPAVITLRRPASINELAVCLGHAGDVRTGWFRALRNLNPQYDNKQVLPEGTQLEVPAVVVQAYQRDCVQGPLAQVAAELNGARLPVSPLPIAARAGGSQPSTPGRVHTVRSGETLYAIATRNRCNMVALARANHIRGPNYPIRPGQRIDLTVCR